jgi:hypothetical protein
MRLPTAYLILMLAIAAGGCKPHADAQDAFTRPQIDWRPALVLDAEDAMRILGNPGRLEKATAYLDDGIKVYQSAFRDDWRDPNTGKTGILYYMYEEYPSAQAARSFLVSTLKANHVDLADGIRTKSGAELHYLTGGEVVRMAMVLKGNQMIRLKVNQLTSRYQLGNFKDIAGELANRL